LPDYTEMTDSEMLAELRDDAAKWAKAFCQHAEKLGHPGIDEGWMIGWFANAIEHSYDVRTGRVQIVLPDGTSFFLANVAGTDA
jgi:hypothetical protein